MNLITSSMLNQYTPDLLSRSVQHAFALLSLHSVQTVSDSEQPASTPDSCRLRSLPQVTPTTIRASELTNSRSGNNIHTAQTS